MHGEADQIVPFWMGKKIFDLANNPKYSYFTEYDDHMMEYDSKLVSELNNSFLVFCPSPHYDVHEGLHIGAPEKAHATCPTLEK